MGAPILEKTKLEHISTADVPRILTEIPGPKSRKILQEQKSMETGTIIYPRSFPMAIKSANGSVVEDADSNLLIDWFTGICVLNLGYSASVRRAVAGQLEKTWHTMEIPTDTRIEFLERLRSSFPPAMRDYRTVFGISGADACETAVNLAHSVSGRNGVTIAFDGAYHGASGGIISITSGEEYRRPVLSQGFRTAHIPYPSRNGPVDMEKVHERLEGIFSNPPGGEKPDSLIVEPIQGEGGYIVPPDGFLKLLRDFCDSHGLLMIADEIQSGMGRTGKMWAFEHEGVKPDVVCVGKSIGGGVPVSLVYYRDDLDRQLPTPFHMGTFRGNPLALAAGIEMLKETPAYLERVSKTGEKLLGSFTNIESPLISDVRGRGFMIGIELADNGKPLPRQKMLAIKHRLLGNGLMMHTCGKDGNVFRFMGALNIPDELLEKGIRIFESGLKLE